MTNGYLTVVLFIKFPGGRFHVDIRQWRVSSFIVIIVKIPFHCNTLQFKHSLSYNAAIRRQIITDSNVSIISTEKLNKSLVINDDLSLYILHISFK